MTFDDQPKLQPPAGTRARKRAEPGSLREKGLRTRSRILDATLKVIARDGIRSVTHRSAAAEAGVHLSLTTYYFTDIQEMIREAFQQFCEREHPDVVKALADASSYLQSFSARELRKRTVRQQICMEMAVLVSDQIYIHILHHSERLAIEQILFTEARLSPEVRKMGERYRKSQIEGLAKLCRYFNRDDPESDAELLFGSITSMEYQNLAVPKSSVDRDHITALLRRQMGWIIGVRSA